MTKILIIEDSDALVDILSRFLTKKKYDVASASSGQEALKKIPSYNPDIALLDVKLNGADGREICSYIKSHKENSVKILLISASPELLKNYQSFGADDVLKKPFDLNTILQKLDKLTAAI
jgi:DNA-binding response OmpR family regulator